MIPSGNLVKVVRAHEALTGTPMLEDESQVEKKA
jgi:hypothetical protein